MTRIALISPDETFGERLRRAAAAIGGTVLQPAIDAEAPERGVASVLANGPGIIVIGPDVSTDASQRWTEALDESRLDVPVLWVVEPTPESWRQALQSGARDLIDPGAGDIDLEAALRRADSIRDRRSEALQSAMVAEPAAVGTGGRLVVVASPKGGSGKTMLSTNLAYGLRVFAGKSVVLVDLDLQFGDVAAALQLRPEYTVLNGLKVTGDPTAVKAFLAPHPSGFYVLAAPSNPVEADGTDFESLGKLLDLLRHEFDFVVVDTGAGIDEATLIALEQATDVAFITTPDLAAIQALRKAVLVMDQLQLTSHRRWYVLNRADARVGLSQHDIERSTGLTLDIALPSSRVVPVAMNQGRTVLEEEERGTVGRALRNTVDLFVGASQRPGSDEESHGLISRWFGKGESS